MRDNRLASQEASQLYGGAKDNDKLYNDAVSKHIIQFCCLKSIINKKEKIYEGKAEVFNLENSLSLQEWAELNDVLLSSNFLVDVKKKATVTIS